MGKGTRRIEWGEGGKGCGEGVREGGERGKRRERKNNNYLDSDTFFGDKRRLSGRGKITWKRKSVEY